MIQDRESLIEALRRRRKIVKNIDGLIADMRTADARIGRLNLVARDGEPVVVLIGRGARAADLAAAYDALDVDQRVSVNFDPPVRLG